MTLITAGELARIRADFVDCFDSTAVVQTYSRTPDGAGGQTETWTPGASIKARIAPMGGGEATQSSSRRGEAGGRVDARTTHVISLPPETAVTAKDRIAMNGSTYEVTAVRTRTDEVIRRCEVRELA